ncbi:hypothetical protein JK361_28620 [Streptomyces sp. 5-8]|uniref:Uncharacterized protein n=1 Tax=Streptomyces musisoli TaxID=2802280 RepID=A0ABS1P8L8_9ACTN|nr:MULTISPECIES: hypothetical protein [Streptomyces]MBL1108504.1 hypothetical protein [Streptomyces musisoli]MBY8841235.1 hypothetical protein [Streptomyces sp. SP2-10]
MTDSSPIRPVQYRDGRPVPHITAWSREQVPPQPLAVIHGHGGRGLGFEDEVSHIDRHYDVPWMRMPATRGGHPRYENVHALRQRQAMSRLLCQMCGGPTLGTRRDERSLFLVASAGGRPIADGELTTSPPTHAVCARLALEHCPPLRRRGWAAALVEHTPVWGVSGLLYHPQSLEPVPTADVSGMHRISFTDDRSLRWTLAARLIIALEGVTAVTDLDVLSDEGTAVARGSR